MEIENNVPGNDQDNTQWKTGNEEGHTPGFDTTKHGLETDGPNKSKPFNVLNQDGSFADYQEREVPGAGALDGTIGLGT